MDFLLVASLLIPYLSFIVIPPAAFCTTIIILHKFLIDKELIILKNIGLNNIQIAKPFLLFSFLITLISYSISLYFLPISYSKFKNLQIYFKDHYASILLEEGVFSSQMSNLTVYVDKKIDDTTYNGIFVFDNRESAKPKIISAQQGKIIKSTSDSWFELYQGSHQEKNLKTGNINILFFDKYSLNLNLFGEDTARLMIEPNERYVNQLFFISPEEHDKKNKLITNGHFRITWPLYCITFLLIPCAFLITGQYYRKQRHIKNLIIAGIGLLVIILTILFNNLTLHNLNFGILMYLNPLIPIWLSLSTLNNKKLT